MTQSINDKGVCRTALATPGLLTRVRRGSSLIVDPPLAKSITNHSRLICQDRILWLGGTYSLVWKKYCILRTNSAIYYVLKPVVSKSYCHSK